MKKLIIVAIGVISIPCGQNIFSMGYEKIKEIHAKGPKASLIAFSSEGKRIKKILEDKTLKNHLQELVDNQIEKINEGEQAALFYIYNNTNKNLNATLSSFSGHEEEESYNLAGDEVHRPLYEDVIQKETISPNNGAAFQISNMESIIKKEAAEGMLRGIEIDLHKPGKSPRTFSLKKLQEEIKLGYSPTTKSGKIFVYNVKPGTKRDSFFVTYSKKNDNEWQWKIVLPTNKYDPIGSLQY